MSGRRPTRMVPALSLLGLLTGDVLAGDVNLGKIPTVAASDWSNKTLTQVMDPEAIARIVLLKAVTSAPASLDLINIRRMLKDAANRPLQVDSAPASPWQLGTADSIWEAVILMRSGEVFGLVIGPVQSAQDRNHRLGCLSAESGERGCFDIPSPVPEFD